MDYVISDWFRWKIYLALARGKPLWPRTHKLFLNLVNYPTKSEPHQSVVIPSCLAKLDPGTVLAKLPMRFELDFATGQPKLNYVRDSQFKGVEGSYNSVFLTYRNQVVAAHGGKLRNLVPGEELAVKVDFRF